MIVRNASFQGPAGSQGQQGATGATGPAGSTAVGNTADSPTLTNITAFTSFANLQSVVAANSLAVGSIVRARYSGIITSGAAQGVAIQVLLGTAGMQNPTWTLPTAIATYHWSAELETIIRTAGAGGTCSQTLRISFQQDATSNAQTFTVTQDTAIDTTAGQTIHCQFASGVANNTAIARSFTVDRFN